MVVECTGGRKRVSTSGLVTGLHPGVVDITATSGSVSAKAPTKVWPRAVSVWYVWIRPDSPTLDVGDSLQVTAIADANDALQEYPVTWKSLTPNVATISSNGIVRARTSGEATIEATFVEPPDRSDLTVCPTRTFLGTTIVKVR